MVFYQKNAELLETGGPVDENVESIRGVSPRKAIPS